MRRLSFSLIVLALALTGSGCGKKPAPAAQASAPAAAESTPAPTQTPEAPTPTPEPTPVVSNSRVIVFCYHRFEDPARDSLALTPKDFEAQMQALKDAGITVISMADFLAWRRGEKEIPEKSAVISIDDGYISGYSVAWPILKKFDYPFTMYIYTNYVSSGGKSVTWDQLREMADAGVDIGSHSVSHASMTKKGSKTDAEYEEWLLNELAGSKAILERELGIPMRTFAYPFGIHNERVQQLGLQSGYEALFTVYGQKVPQNAPAPAIGRYAIESTKPEVFQSAIKFTGGAAAVRSTAQLAASNMLTQPMEGEVVKDPFPEIKVNLAALGNVDPKSIEVLVSGFGIVPHNYDAQTKLLTVKLRQKLREKAYTVIVSAKAGGKKVETRWNFFFDPNAKP